MGSVVIQVRTLRLGEAKFAQSHKAGECWSCDSNPDLLQALNHYIVPTGADSHLLGLGRSNPQTTVNEARLSLIDTISIREPLPSQEREQSSRLCSGSLVLLLFCFEFYYIIFN